MTQVAVLVLRVLLVMASWIAAMRITATLKGGYTSLNCTFGGNEKVLTDDSSVIMTTLVQNSVTFLTILIFISAYVHHR